MQCNRSAISASKIYRNNLKAVEESKNYNNGYAYFKHISGFFGNRQKLLCSQIQYQGLQPQLVANNMKKEDDFIEMPLTFSL